MNHINEVIRPFNKDFRSFLDNSHYDYQDPTSFKARAYCLGQFLITPFRFVSDTLGRLIALVRTVGKTIFDIIRLGLQYDGLMMLSNAIQGNLDGDDSYDNAIETNTQNARNLLIRDFKQIGGLLVSIPLSPFALIAEEVRLLVGVINPAWSFTY